VYWTIQLAPIVAVIGLFQVLVLRQPFPELVSTLTGLGLVIVGLALFPVGRSMAFQLTEGARNGGNVAAMDYLWVYLFAFLVGFSTTIAEPSLIAVAHKAHEASRQAISAWGLRIAVAIGVAVGITLGTFRIVTGTPLYLYIMVGYIVVIIQTTFAPPG